MINRLRSILDRVTFEGTTVAFATPNSLEVRQPIPATIICTTFVLLIEGELT
jgi:hypothetical protein